MNYLFFIASFNALFFLVLLLQKKPKQLHDKVLISWLVYLAIATGTYAFVMDYFADSHFLSIGVIALFLLQGPFLYLYVSAFTFKHKKFQFVNAWHFFPFVAFISYLLIASQFPVYSAGIRIDHVDESVAKSPLLFLIFLGITAISGPIYFILAHKQYRKIKLSNLNYSSKEINIEWLGKLITIFGIIWTLLIIVAVIHHIFHLFSMVFCTDGLYLSLSAFIILIGYFGLKQKEVLISFSSESEEPLPENKIKYASSRLGDAESQKCFDRIQRYMQGKKLYLDPDLTLPKLAQELDIPAHHLSQVINEMHGRNFFDFINQFRVEEVKRKIQDDNFNNYSLFGIALESGFNSKSAFNRVFKNLTGITPSQFRNSIK